MIGYVVSMQFTVADMDTDKRLDDERWEAFFDRLMDTLVDREYAGAGNYGSSSCASTARASDHLLDVSVLVRGPNDAIAYRMGWEAIWQAVTRMANRVRVCAQGGQCWRDEWDPTSENPHHG